MPRHTDAYKNQGERAIDFARHIWGVRELARVKVRDVNAQTRVNAQEWERVWGYVEREQKSAGPSKASMREEQDQAQNDQGFGRTDNQECQRG